MMAVNNLDEFNELLAVAIDFQTHLFMTTNNCFSKVSYVLCRSIARDNILYSLTEYNIYFIILLQQTSDVGFEHIRLHGVVDVCKPIWLYS